MSHLLAATGIGKSFAGIHALRDVSFDLAAGEVHALVGENGAGKSTLIRILTGAVGADQGTLAIDGDPVDLAGMMPAVARALGIAVIYQQPALFPHLSVTENLALALERQSAWRPIDWRARRTRAVALLDQIGAAIDPDRLVSTLSMPEQQMVEIAKALGADARIVLMDEPTASLTDREVAHLFGVIGGLRQRGIGVIYISHRLEEVFRLADRITVLRDGEAVGTRPAQQFSREQLVSLMAGRDLATDYPRRTPAVGDVALEVRHLSSADAGLRDISFSVRGGEILGIAGLVGSGRTELAEVIFGLRRPDEGQILVQGVPARVASPTDAERLGIAYVPEDRRRHGVILDMPVSANTSLSDLSSVSNSGLIDRARERSLASRYVEALQIKTPSVDVPVSALSGGNQQKVSLARWLATEPRILILDEPTQGVDVAAKAEIHAIVRALVERGMAVVMISSELQEILGMSDRIAVMHRGTIAGVVDGPTATAETVLALALAPAPAALGAA